MNQLLLNNFKDCVNIHYSDIGLEAPDICSYLGCSISSLRSILFHNYGYSIMRYIKYFRILKAIELTCKGEKKVYSMVGYKSCSSFSRAFLKVMKFNTSLLHTCQSINYKFIIKTVLNAKTKNPEKVIESITKYVLKKIHSSKKRK